MPGLPGDIKLRDPPKAFRDGGSPDNRRSNQE
jgi:hypothetical protein